MERIELGEHPHQALRVWESGQLGHWRHVLLEIGTLDSGGWYASQSRRGRTLAWVAGDERQACTAVERWMVRLGDDWQETTGQEA